ncbi:hypothetical protein TRFO_20258 [Tritrichomonas foetus]|uniref:Uncharacterized protein n=1 Tax=Tritrichomonas foetus TaxID=1144522 RepID=A0A1J4KGD8_9EUKA|nr:hypothetical protein TRFO_20258 [Tritrichomonas foetus]|eukprot:OHT10449.1 hypothetical protein TRFO_20258 [Tritrichomonas foetus]
MVPNPTIPLRSFLPISLSVRYAGFSRNNVLIKPHVPKYLSATPNLYSATLQSQSNLLKKINKCATMSIPEVVPEETMDQSDIYFIETLSSIYYDLKSESHLSKSSNGIHILNSICQLLFRTRKHIPSKYLYIDVKLSFVNSNWLETQHLYKILAFFIKNTKEWISNDIIHSLVFSCEDIIDAREIKAIQKIFTKLTTIVSFRQNLFCEILKFFQYINEKSTYQIDDEIAGGDEIMTNQNGLQVYCPGNSLDMLLDTFLNIINLNAIKNFALAYINNPINLRNLISELLKLFCLPFLDFYSQSLFNVMEKLLFFVKDKQVFRHMFHFLIIHWPVQCLKKQLVFSVNAISLLKYIDNEVSNYDINRFNNLIRTFIERSGSIQSIKVINLMMRVKEIKYLDSINRSIADNLIEILTYFSKNKDADQRLKTVANEKLALINSIRIIKATKAMSDKNSSSNEEYVRKTWSLLRRLAHTNSQNNNTNTI